MLSVYMKKYTFLKIIEDPINPSKFPLTFHVGILSIDQTQQLSLTEGCGVFLRKFHQEKTGTDSLATFPGSFDSQ